MTDSTDSTILSLRRRVRSGDPDAEMPLLIARLRAGDIVRADVELAAYCGHAPSRKLLKPQATVYNPWCPCDLGRPFGPHTDCCEDKSWNSGCWVSGLARWGAQVMLRASITAAEEALLARYMAKGRPHADGSGCPGGRLCFPLCAARDAIQAAKEWQAAPGSETSVAWEGAFVARENDRRRWVPMPETYSGSVFRSEEIHSACRVAGQGVVIHAIKTALMASLMLKGA